MEKDKFLGRIDISPDAVELIIGIAVSKMKEVVSVQGITKKHGLTDWLTHGLVSKGVHFKQDETGYTVDLYVSLLYGVSIPKVAQDIQKRVKEQVLYMCDLDIDSVNVHVTQLVSEIGEQVD